MKIVDAKTILAVLENHDEKIYLIPTMGALHAGHISLVQKATELKKQNKHQNAKIIVSIFVNPTQFGENEDFDKYPRDLEKDAKKLENLGVDYLLTPKVEEIYNNDEITLSPPKIMGYALEGESRPTHFGGMLSVVLKLLNLTKADFAFFGRKDAQQLLLIKKLVKDYFLKVKIIECPIVRDIDGLALSSRNIYLSKKEREAALYLSASLLAISQALKSGIKESQKLKETALAVLENGKKLCNFEIQYLAFCNEELQEVEIIQGSGYTILLTVKVGKTRLLDNLFI